MIRLSVNVNKVATLRNSRGGQVPSVLDAVAVCVAAGAPGITVHPRADRRHITPDDVRAIAGALRAHRPAERGEGVPAEPVRGIGPPGVIKERGEGVPAEPVRGIGAPGVIKERGEGVPPGVKIEFNVEGDPRPDLLDLVEEVRPDQCTLVPVVPGEVTSHAGWQPGPGGELLPEVVARLKALGIRVSLFVDAEPGPIQWAASAGADRVELYTEPFARAFERGADAARRSFAHYAEAARLAHAQGLAVNAGHDLDLANLVLFRDLPFLAEVSIGHAIVSRALFVGLPTAVQEYLDVLKPAEP